MAELEKSVAVSSLPARLRVEERRDLYVVFFLNGCFKACSCHALDI